MSLNGTFLTADSHQSFLSRRLTSVIGKKLSRRFKRLIYISSVMGLLEEVKDPDMRVIQKLNEIFKIAKYPDAIVFPMYIKSLIWKDVSSMAVMVDSDKQLALHSVMRIDLTTEEFTAIGEHFAKRAPSWLRYGSVESMVEDVVKLIHQLKRYHITPRLGQGAY